MNDIGIIGLGVMGRNLALNIEDKGYKVSVYNHNADRTQDFMSSVAGKNGFSYFYDIGNLVNSLKKPRKLIIMTVSGEPVDNTIKSLFPYLEKGDLIMDGGNANFHDTIRRIEEVEEQGLLYLGIGISGGEYGALNGPSIMPGGTKEAYNLVEDLLIKAAAETKYGPCCTYIGNGAAGHFIKMVHNGIEYGMMQAISEVYHILKKVLKLSDEEVGDIFEEWNKENLNSYLMEISYKIMRFKDEETGKPIVEIILDKAGQKGTGRWTVEAGLNLGIPIPSLNVSVESRIISSFKEERVNISKKVSKNYPSVNICKDKLIEGLENTLMFTNFILFSQGLWVMSEASKAYNFDIDISDVLKIWTGGCIIRARMLDDLIEIIEDDRENVNLLNSEKSLNYLMGKLNSVKYILNIAMDYYIPSFVINSSLDYFYSMTTDRLPANLIQAQRDFFGAHTYNRTDRKGIFHTIWE